PPAPEPPAPSATVLAPAPAPSSPPQRSSSAWVGVFVGAESLAAGNLVVPQVGLAALVEQVGPSARIGLSVDGDLHRTVDVPSEFGTVALGGGSAHALLSLGRSFGRSVTRAALGFGLAVSDVRLSSGITTISARPRTDLDPSIALQVRWDFPLAAHLDV